MTSAAAKAKAGKLSFEEFLDIFASHNRIYNDEVRVATQEPRLCL